MVFSAEKAIVKRIILLAGDEEQLRRRALEQLMHATQVQKDDFDLEYAAGDVGGPVEWFGSAGTAPFLASRRIVVVRHLLRCEPDKAKSVDFSKLPESSLLILVADDESGADDKLRRWSTAWEKVVVKAGGLVEKFPSSPQEAKETVRTEVERLGKTMSNTAVDTLIEMCGGSVSRALDELEKLALFAGEQEQIREGDVREVVVPSRDWNVYKMVDSIIVGSIPEALRQLRILVGSQAKAEDAAIGRILPNVSRQLRLIWQARVCLDAKCRPSNPTPSVLALLPERPNITAEPPYRQSALANTARKIPLERLQACFAVLSDADARLKGGLPAFSGMDSLERLVLDMDRALR